MGNISGFSWHVYGGSTQDGEEPTAFGTKKYRVRIDCERGSAEATGFEPAVSALTGLHVRPLHHASERGPEDTTLITHMSTPGHGKP